MKLLTFASFASRSAICLLNHPKRRTSRVLQAAASHAYFLGGGQQDACVSIGSHHGRNIATSATIPFTAWSIVQRCRPMRYSRTAGTEATADTAEEMRSLRISSRISVSPS